MPLDNESELTTTSLEYLTTTSLEYRQVYCSLDKPVLIEHIPNATIQVLNGEYRGGQGKDGGYQLHVVIITPPALQRSV